MTRPRMSVVLACPDGPAPAALTVRCLAAQSAVEELELVLVTPFPERTGELGDVLAAFAGVQSVELDPVPSAAAANALGARHAQAPVVAFAEDHSFPEPGWAAALLERHEGPWAAVGPAVANANPGTVVSWCDLLLGYGPWLAPAEGGEATMLPGHNSSYRREVLLAQGERLERLLDAEAVLHTELRAAGQRLFHEPRAVTRHVNFARLGKWLGTTLWAGRVFAAARARPWSRPRRLAYAAGSPLVPLVRLARMRHLLARPLPGRPSRARLVPLLLLGLAVDAAGQGIGCLLGADDEVLADAPTMEFRRLDHVPPADRLSIASLDPLDA